MDANARISRLIVVSVLSILTVVSIVKIYIDENTEEPSEIIIRDYNEIKESGILNVALSENATEYCIFNANPRGFQLETLNDFATAHGIELNVIIANTEKEAEKLLAEEKCDIIVKHTAQSDSCSSEPLINSNLIILSRTKKISDTLYIIGMQNFCIKNQGRTIISIDSISSERLARKVASGEITSAICDSALALTYQKAYPRLEIDTSICLSRQIRWKTRPESKVLLDSINSWLSRERETKHFKLRHEIYYSYININVSRKYYSGNNGQISAYDDLIKRHSKKLGWDWRLIASLICEESRFIPDISNPSGAYGLMQLMPSAYQKFAHDSADISNPDVQMAAGIKHVAYLKKRTPEAITDTSVIVRYVLMGYNAGHGHSEDAYALAQKYTGNPNSWKNLALYMEHLNDREFYTDPEVKCGKYKGSRTVKFTNNVIDRYKHYRNLIKD